jgi:ribosomal protein L29
MAANLTATELRKMPVADLRKEISSHQSEMAKMRLGLEMRSFKDSAKLRRFRKELARMLTVVSEKENQLKEGDSPSRVPVRRRKAGSSRAAPASK